jgi:peptidoglycan/xylan/chitin deacetylase (PgdA/CDA1 family)
LISAGRLKRGVALALVRSGMLNLHRSRVERARAAILLYHRVNDEADPFFPALGVKAFVEQAEYLARHYDVQPLESTLDWLAQGAPGRPRAVLTFDDGYPDTHDIVLPALRRLGLPATLFLCTGPPETGRLVWSDRVRLALREATAPEVRLGLRSLARLPLHDQEARRRAAESVVSRMKELPPPEIATTLAQLEEQAAPRAVAPRVLAWEEVRAIARGTFSLGAHTHNHFLLSRLPTDEIAREVAASVDLIERRVGVKVRTFAYPNGRAQDYDERCRAALSAQGIRYALTSRHGFARVHSDPFQIARLYTTETYLPLFAARLAGITREPSQEAS